MNCDEENIPHMYNRGQEKQPAFGAACTVRHSRAARSSNILIALRLWKCVVIHSGDRRAMLAAAALGVSESGQALLHAAGTVGAARTRK